MKNKHIYNLKNVSISSNGGDVLIGGIKITNIYKSFDYQDLLERIKEIEEDLYEISNLSKQMRIRKSQKLEELKQKEIDFKEDVRRLAETFSKININTKRLKDAYLKFQEGDFKSANTILVTSDIKKEKQLLKDEQKKILENTTINEEKLANNAAEWLIKAQITLTDLSDSERINLSEEYFLESIDSFKFPDNLFAYAQYLFYNKKDYKLALANCLEAQEMSTQQYDDDISILAVKGEFILLLPQIYIALQDFEKGIHWYKEFLNLFKEFERQDNSLVSKKEVSRTLRLIGRAYSQLGDYVNSNNYLYEALSYYNEIKNFNEFDEIIASVEFNIATNCHKLNDHSNSYLYFHKSIDQYRNLFLSNRLSANDDFPEMLLRISWIVHETDLKKAITLAKEGVEILETLATTSPIIILPKLGKSKSHLGKLFETANDFELAKKNYVEALEIWENLNTSLPKEFIDFLMISYLDLSIFNMHLKNYEECVSIAFKALIKNIEITNSGLDLSNTYFDTIINILESFGVDWKQSLDNHGIKVSL